MFCFVFPGFASPLDSQNPSGEDYQSKHIFGSLYFNLKAQRRFFGTFRLFCTRNTLMRSVFWTHGGGERIFSNVIELWMRIGCRLSLDTFNRFLLKKFTWTKCVRPNVSVWLTKHTNWVRDLFKKMLSIEIHRKPIFVQELRKNQPICPFATSSLLHER